MAVEIYMPALSPTMEKGTLAKWLVSVGDTVESGDVLAEIETDKATMEVESIDEGVIAKIYVDEGTDDVPVGKLIAVLAEEDEDTDAAIASVDSGSSDAEKAEEKPADKAESKKEEPKTEAKAEKQAETKPSKSSETSKDGDRIKASPLAKRLAEQAGIDLKDVKGTGPYGRIVKRDIESYEPSSKASASSKAVKSDVPLTSGDNPYEDQKLSTMRKTIARRLTESKQSVPHFYLTVECDLDKLLAVRRDVNIGLEARGQKVSVNDFIIKAAARALKAVPAANVQFGGDTMRWFERADISVAVAIDGGLITPVVRGACEKSLSEIADEVKDLARRAKDGKLAPEEYTGGTFSISNLGMFGIKEFSAVINPPEAAILAVGAGEQRPVVKDGELTVATMMSVTMSCDHRAIDGAVGAEFLKAFKGFLENPLTMLV